MTYIKQCPYCNSTENQLVFNPVLTRMVSECLDCRYVGASIFPDVKKTVTALIE